MPTDTPRLPIYLVVDCSASMAGEPIEAVKYGIKALLLELRSDPETIATAYLSVIAYNSIARQIMPLLAVDTFLEPDFRCMGSSALGEAFGVLAESIKKDVKQATPTQEGDWKPLVFLLTDGGATDDWEESAASFLNTKQATVIACAAGAEANIGVLQKITKHIVMLNSLSSGSLAQYFTWA